MKRIVNGEEVVLEAAKEVQVTPLQDRLSVRTTDGAHSALSVHIGDTVHISYRGHIYVVGKTGKTQRGQAAASSGEIHATMPGLIVDVFAKEGQKVMRGENLVVLEAMKTQQAFTAPFDGVVSQVKVAKGRQVADGELLLTLLVEPGE